MNIEEARLEFTNLWLSFFVEGTLTLAKRSILLERRIEAVLLTEGVCHFPCTMQRGLVVECR
jgi:hypothetical protein